MSSSTKVFETIEAGEWEKVQEIIVTTSWSQADLDLENRHGGQGILLMKAAKLGKEDVVHLLLNAGASIEAIDANASTPLIEAARNGRSEMVALLVDRGARMHVRDNDGWTAIHWAVEAGHLKTVEILLDRGADIETRTTKGGWTPLLVAAVYSRSEAAALLINRGANIHALDAGGWTALHRAAQLGHLRVVEILLDRGADMEARDENGSTPLVVSAASFDGRTSAAVALFIDRGAKINAQNNEGRSALIESAYTGHVAAVKLLCHKGADMNIKDKVHGRNALYWARQTVPPFSKRMDVIDCIIEEAEWQRVENFVVFLHTDGLSSADWSARRLGGGGSMLTTDSTAASPDIPSLGFTGRRSKQSNVLENRDLCRIVASYIPKLL